MHKQKKNNLEIQVKNCKKLTSNSNNNEKGTFYSADLELISDVTQKLNIEYQHIGH